MPIDPPGESDRLREPIVESVDAGLRDVHVLLDGSAADTERADDPVTPGYRLGNYCWVHAV